jgi:diguanylate cyclase (GGDEF)-like protein/PAS domain S-box-containing protein
MPEDEFRSAMYALPDGSVRRLAETEVASSLLAAEILSAAITRTAEELAASQLVAAQQSAAREVVIAAAADLARGELAAQELAAAENLAAENLAADTEVAAAEEVAATAVRTFSEKISTVTDVPTLRILATEELTAARHNAARALDSARQRADRQLVTAAQLAASQISAAAMAARLEQAKQLATAQSQTARELATAQSQTARELATAQSQTARELATAAGHAAAQLLASQEEGARDLADAAEQFRLFMDMSGVAGCTVSNDGRFLRVNPALCTLVGRTEESLLGATWDELIHPDDVSVFVDLVRDLLAGRQSSLRTLIRYLAADGRVVWGDLCVAAVLNTDGTVRFQIAQIIDVTERMDHEATLLSLATHDSLTGLANRAATLDEITRALSAGNRLGRSTAVLQMGLDNFKKVNDSLGHGAGDQLLQAAAGRIQNAVRAGDLAARLGGDDFVIVMRDLDDSAEAIQTAWRLVEAFRPPFFTSGTESHSTASIGVALATPMQPVQPDDLMRQADTAMYAAKAQGRDRVVVFNEDLQTVVSNRLAIENALRHALDFGQLAVWYQPEVDLTTGAVVAVEALLRWHHPDGSVWTADRFIDVAEDTGLILDIGAWVLRQACNQGAAWASARPDRPITVRVNASVLQLADDGLIEAIDAALTVSSLNPNSLCIEITETALLRETATASANLARIHDRGIGIALDDFGTGYASLTYLRRYHIDVLKIDRSFVTSITTDDTDREIVAAIIALAVILGKTVTAEGVEHAEQATVLRQLGCPSTQGWLYSKALPAEDVTPLLDHTYPHS